MEDMESEKLIQTEAEEEGKGNKEQLEELENK